MADLAVAQRVEGGDVELHHALIDALAKEHANVRGHLVALGDDDRHLAAHFGIAGAHGGPHLAQLGLAAAMTHVGEDIDRGVGEEFDVVKRTRTI